MPKPTYETLDEGKRTKLLEAAMKEFAAHGYELASINRILEEAGFSKGSFYYYFEDKLDLAATVFFVCAEPETKLLPLADPKNAEEFWIELRRNSLERLKKLESKRLEYSALIRLANALLSNVELAARVMPMFVTGREMMMNFFKRGVELGALRSDIPLTTLMSIIEAMKTAAYKAAYPNDVVPSDPEMERFSDFVIDLARRVSAAPPKKEG
jgi:AcrR family transcriptional regulator